MHPLIDRMFAHILSVCKAIQAFQTLPAWTNYSVLANGTAYLLLYWHFIWQNWMLSATVLNRHTDSCYFVLLTGKRSDRVESGSSYSVLPGDALAKYIQMSRLVSNPGQEK